MVIADYLVNEIFGVNMIPLTTDEISRWLDSFFVKKFLIMVGLYGEPL
jgi:hypothetical protein